MSPPLSSAKPSNAPYRREAGARSTLTCHPTAIRRLAELQPLGVVTALPHSICVLSDAYLAGQA
jgi:hypothetical protein